MAPLKTLFNKSLRLLASVELTLLNLILMFILVFASTLAQTHMGAYAAQDLYLERLWLTLPLGDSFSFPVFPGGLTIGALWALNLAASFWQRRVLFFKRKGLFLAHGGLLLLLAGQFFTQVFAVESQMSLREGEAKNNSVNFRRVELAVTETSHPDYDEITSVPAYLLKNKKAVDLPSLPFVIHPLSYFPNASLQRQQTPSPGAQASEGDGASFYPLPLPSTRADAETDTPAALVQMTDRQGKDRGRWLLSAQLAPQTFLLDNKTFTFTLRHQQIYFPFTLGLIKFSHDRYPGTNIPKNFSSLVRLVDEEQGENREVLISMNNPLRYRGATFYQASFGENDTLSVFQVVQNPVWISPYLACAMVAAGLFIHFLHYLLPFLKRRAP